jgi:hypothetical protein
MSFINNEDLPQLAMKFVDLYNGSRNSVSFDVRWDENRKESDCDEFKDDTLNDSGSEKVELGLERDFKVTGSYSNNDIRSQTILESYSDSRIVSQRNCEVNPSIIKQVISNSDADDNIVQIASSETVTLPIINNIPVKSNSDDAIQIVDYATLTTIGQETPNTNDAIQLVNSKSYKPLLYSDDPIIGNYETNPSIIKETINYETLSIEGLPHEQPTTLSLFENPINISIQIEAQIVDDSIFCIINLTPTTTPTILEKPASNQNIIYKTVAVIWNTTVFITTPLSFSFKLMLIFTKICKYQLCKYLYSNDIKVI